jgi:hypothetical protein
MLRSLWLCLAIGCSFEHAAPVGNNTADGGSADGALPNDDSSMISADAGLCWSVAGVSLNVCLTEPLGGTINITNDTSIDTTTNGNSPLTCKPLMAGSSDVCVIAAQTITIDAETTLSATGTRPLVLLATTLTLTGAGVDVASHRGGQQGAASTMVGCDSGAPATAAGGGQGGSFGGKGGDGGNQDGQSNSRGRAGNVLAVTTLRGGCPGGAGGGGNPGAQGGGAVALVADTISAASARINASGAGAVGGDQGDEGGSGAGAGGMIVLAAGTISVNTSTEIFANGGHGGGGSSSGSAGEPGGDPTSPASGGGGGNGPDNAGNGGAGFPLTFRNGQSGTGSNDGGGGGGGGAGIIKVVSPSLLTGAQVSPPPS